VKKARHRWRSWQGILEQNRLVFLDESGAKTNMTRRRGRAKGGQRCLDDAPHGHWCTTTMISSIRLDGTTACVAIDGATSSEIFREYVRQMLVPTLRTGDIVIFDNLPAHKDAEALDLIHAAGAMTLPLPAYSPDLNPIEKMWSKVKEFLRSAKARTFDALIDAIGEGLKTVTDQDAKGWFASCGYVAGQS
jgi:transposase|tara:strand:- start:11 stop:583 length:573 start_codon:yes stop_codon:yes gene_type:complete